PRLVFNQTRLFFNQTRHEWTLRGCFPARKRAAVASFPFRPGRSRAKSDLDRGAAMTAKAKANRTGWTLLVCGLLATGPVLADPDKPGKPEKKKLVLTLPVEGPAQ